MRGYSLLEILVAVALLGLVAAIAGAFLNTKPEAELVACAAEADVMRSFVELAQMETRRTPTFDEVMMKADGRWNDHYHYVWDEPDPNSGHGNDLDFCDEDNPSGNLSHVGGECYDVKWVIVCDHNHSAADAGYVAVIGSSNFPSTPHVFGGDPNHKFVKDLKFWNGKDPNFQKWIGRY
jgi:prepilin-type N-terminal cleavage/methylation domain-containing protein